MVVPVRGPISVLRSRPEWGWRGDVAEPRCVRDQDTGSRTRRANRRERAACPGQAPRPHPDLDSCAAAAPESNVWRASGESGRSSHPGQYAVPAALAPRGSPKWRSPGTLRRAVARFLRIRGTGRSVTSRSADFSLMFCPTLLFGSSRSGLSLTSPGQTQPSHHRDSTRRGRDRNSLRPSGGTSSDKLALHRAQISFRSTE